MSVVRYSIPDTEARDIHVQAAIVQRARIHLARMNFPYFMEYVLGLQPTWFHEEWIEHFSMNQRGVLQASRGFAKSTYFSVALPLWLVGRDPNIRIALISATAGQSDKFLREIGHHIEFNPRYRQVFGNLRDSSQVWTQKQKTVRRSKPLKDATLMAIGQGTGFAGSRTDLIIFDDIVDSTNSLTKHRRKQVLQWIFETALPTLDPSGLNMAWMICTPYHFDDATHHLGKSWPSWEYPAVNERGEANWPERFPLDELDRRRREAQKAGREQIFDMQYLLMVAGIEGNRLKLRWLHESPEPPVGDEIEIWGYDTAVIPEDETDIYTPDYSAVVKCRVRRWGLELYDIIRMQAEVPDVIDEICRQVEQNGRVSMIGVESTGVGKVAIQILSRSTENAVPLVPVSAAGSAITRMGLMAPQFAGGQITIAQDATDMVRKVFTDEWVGFPFYANDDCLHAMDAARRAYFGEGEIRMIIAGGE